MEPIVITIMGIDYKISCPPEKVESLQRSALLLDSRITTMKASGKMSIEQAAILTALNLADELLQSETALKNLRTGWVDRLDELSKSIDSALQKG